MNELWDYAVEVGGLPVALIVFAGSYVFAWGLLSAAAQALIRLGARRGWTVRNYRGAVIPYTLGLVWVVWAALGIAVWALFGADPPLPRGALLVLGAGVLGFLDDRYGDGTARGFLGHVGALARGRVTTGLLKMAGVGALALWSAAEVVGWPLGGGRAAVAWVSTAAGIALSANLLNLLDVRPGRALKGYVGLLVVAAPIAAAGAPLTAAGGAGPLYVAAAGPLRSLLPALAVWRADLRERAMLGDSGANAMGALAGWALMSGLSRWAWASALAALALLALNLASERVSFSSVIARSGLLSGLDRLGRLPESAAAPGAGSGGDPSSEAPGSAPPSPPGSDTL